ncbi:MAG: hypothetical protein BWY57_02720 [Betaproteobacteria bacterium ADurb.Bin341]|nr:MAG: hypothetical protein BWY57_02720 [Betaproteobacteria bacterium ADurb.Bin341]
MRRNTFASGPRMIDRHHDAERLVIHRPFDQPLLLQRQGNHDHVQITRFQGDQQIGREILLEKQRHIRRLPMQRRNQLRQQIGRHRVDHPQAQHTGQGVAPLRGDLLKFQRFLQHASSLRHNAFTHRRHPHIGGTTFEQHGAEPTFHFLDRHRQCRLANVAGLCRSPEMALTRQRHQIAHFRQGHHASNPFNSSTPSHRH